jgi:hypothetical protein
MAEARCRASHLTSVAGALSRVCVFLVNQTFQKPEDYAPKTLTCVSLFHIMNKTRTLCGKFQADLFADGLLTKSAVGFRSIRVQKGVGDVEANREFVCILFPKGNRCDVSQQGRNLF